MREKNSYMGYPKYGTRKRGWGSLIKYLYDDWEYKIKIIWGMIGNIKLK